MSRRALPDRRPNETVDLPWQHGVFTVTLGYDEGGHVREAFLDGHKIGSDAEALLDDACVLLSLALQRGETVAALADALGWEAGTREGPHASLLGALCARAAEVEAARQTALACTRTCEADDEIHESPSSRGVNAGGKACQPDVADGNPASSPLRIEAESPVDGERRRHEGRTEGAGAASAVSAPPSGVGP